MGNIAQEEDFNGYLHSQVCEHPLNDTEAACVHILIDFLDEQGYLTDSLANHRPHTLRMDVGRRFTSRARPFAKL